MHQTCWDVVGIDSFRHAGISERVTHMWEEHPEWRSRTAIHTHDLTTPISGVLAQRLGSVDYIINLASMSDVFDSLENPVPFVKANVDVILNVLEFARERPPRAFLQVSTDEVYGPTDGTFLHKEWDPIVPSSPYSASKAAQEAIAISYWRAYGVPLILVNLMNNFGEMQSPKKFPVIVQRLLQTGQPVTIHGKPGEDGSRHYIHSRNTASALLHLLRLHLPYQHQNGTMDKPDRYNIPGDAQVSNTELANVIGGIMHEPVNVVYKDFHSARPGHDRHYGLDGTKLKETGWTSPCGFYASLFNTVQWQRDHPEWLKGK